MLRYCGLEIHIDAKHHVKKHPNIHTVLETDFKSCSPVLLMRSLMGTQGACGNKILIFKCFCTAKKLNCIWPQKTKLNSKLESLNK